MSATGWTRRFRLFVAAGMLLAGTGVPGRARAADPAPTKPAAPGVVRVGPTTTSSSLSSLPPSQVLEFPNGSHLTVADVRSFGPLIARLRSRGRGVLRQPLTGPTLPVTPSTQRRQLEAAPDTTVLQLPDGRKMTAGQFKAVVPHLPKTASGRAAVVKVARGTPLAELLKHPDSTVLESPGGKRVTVGELRHLAEALPPGIRR